ncbi:MAG: right-handed parallel beta-helix repeat-containing protein [Desulfuromonadaceae bacterium]|nr:right-handed parallel beta-helix repeat-containing protein [Desulfuromonadaceae bacterium]
MKILFAGCVFLYLLTISPAAAQATAVYDGTVLTEDATWRGSVLVRGSVVVVPHATLRIEPGTVVRFAASTGQQLPNLIIQGRLHVAGTSERPILLTSDRPMPSRGSWGGIVFLSTEKNNLLEGCRIEYAETGIDIRFSTVTLKSVSIVHAKTALLSHDGVVQMTGGTVSDSETGIEIYDSEFDGNDVTVASCRRGCLLSKSSVVMASPNIMNNQQTGLEADECRIKITGGEFSGNVLGALIKGGEGDIFMSRFLRNRQTALHLLGSRVKIQRCRFAENILDALRVEDGRALLMNNAFSSNGGFNLFNAGNEVVNARLNWWGGTGLPLVRQKIHDVSRDKKAGAVQILPWLNEQPALMP